MNSRIRVNIGEHEIFSSLLINMKMPTINALLLAFSYLLAEKISCSAELSIKKSSITLGLGYSKAI